MMDATLKTAIEKLMPRYKKDGIAPQPFDNSRRATVTTLNLARVLFAESVRLGAHDGLDFCHAVLASAFSSVAALDKKWKRWIESLPIAKNLARIYYRPQLDAMVNDIDAGVTQLRQGIQPAR